jgi:hypothetical protein
MSQRSKEILIYVLAVVTIAGAVVYFQHHQFHWWLLIIPAISIPLVVMQQRRQQHWDNLRLRRERVDALGQRTLVDAKGAEREPSN